jgi:hypothetical protein
MSALIERLRRSREDTEKRFLAIGRQAGREWAEHASWAEGQRLYAYSRSDDWRLAIAVDSQKAAKMLARAAICNGSTATETAVLQWWEKVVGSSYGEFIRSTTFMFGFVSAANSIWQHVAAMPGGPNVESR